MSGVETPGAFSEHDDLDEDIVRLNIVLQGDSEEEVESDTELQALDRASKADEPYSHSSRPSTRPSTSRPSTSSDVTASSFPTTSMGTEADELVLRFDPTSFSAESSLAMNRAYQEVLLDMLRQIEMALSDNRARQRELSDDLEDKSTKGAKSSAPKIKPLTEYTAPFFRDSEGKAAPSNEDVKLKDNLHEEKQHVKPKLGWTRAQRKVLNNAVRLDALEQQIRPLMNKLEVETGKLANCKTSEEMELNKARIEALKDKVKQKQEMGTDELLANVDINRIDFMKISTIEFKGKYESVECESMWKNVLQPRINRDKWTPQEEESLVELAQTHGSKNWKTIAEELGTNRTPFQCLQHFQQKNFVYDTSEWSQEEDDLLREVVETCQLGAGKIQWQQVSYYMERRSALQCKMRWRKISPYLKRGKWEDHEDVLLSAAIQMIGDSDWVRVQEFVPDRSATQCRERWQNCLDPNLKVGRWTYEEDKKLLQLYEQYGKNWARIASTMTGRTDNMVLCRHKTLLKWKQGMEAFNNEPIQLKRKLLSIYFEFNDDLQVVPKERKIGRMERKRREIELKQRREDEKRAREQEEANKPKKRKWGSRDKDEDYVFEDDQPAGPPPDQWEKTALINDIQLHDYNKRIEDEKNGDLVVPRPPPLKKYTARSYNSTWTRRKALQKLVQSCIASAHDPTVDPQTTMDDISASLGDIMKIDKEDNERWDMISNALKGRMPHELTVRQLLDISRSLKETGTVPGDILDDDDDEIEEDDDELLDEEQPEFNEDWAEMSDELDVEDDSDEENDDEFEEQPEPKKQKREQTEKEKARDRARVLAMREHQEVQNRIREIILQKFSREQPSKGRPRVYKLYPEGSNSSGSQDTRKIQDKSLAILLKSFDVDTKAVYKKANQLRRKFSAMTLLKSTVFRRSQRQQVVRQQSFLNEKEEAMETAEMVLGLKNEMGIRDSEEDDGEPANGDDPMHEDEEDYRLAYGKYDPRKVQVKERKKRTIKVEKDGDVDGQAEVQEPCIMGRSRRKKRRRGRPKKVVETDTGTGVEEQLENPETDTLVISETSGQNVKDKTAKQNITTQNDADVERQDNALTSNANKNSLSSRIASTNAKSTETNTTEALDESAAKTPDNAGQNKSMQADAGAERQDNTLYSETTINAMKNQISTESQGISLITAATMKALKSKLSSTSTATVTNATETSENTVTNNTNQTAVKDRKGITSTSDHTSATQTPRTSAKFGKSSKVLAAPIRESYDKTLPFIPPNHSNLSGMKSLLLDHRSLIDTAGMFFDKEDFKRHLYSIKTVGPNPLLPVFMSVSRLKGGRAPKKTEVVVTPHSKGSRAQLKHPKHALVHKIKRTKEYQRLKARFQSLFAWPSLMSTIQRPRPKPKATETAPAADTDTAQAEVDEGSKASHKVNIQVTNEEGGQQMVEITDAHRDDDAHEEMEEGGGELTDAEVKQNVARAVEEVMEAEQNLSHEQAIERLVEKILQEYEDARKQGKKRNLKRSRKKVSELVKQGSRQRERTKILKRLGLWEVMEGYRQARELNSAGEVEFPLYAGAGPEDKVTVKIEAEEEMEDHQDPDQACRSMGTNIDEEELDHSSAPKKRRGRPKGSKSFVNMDHENLRKSSRSSERPTSLEDSIVIPQKKSQKQRAVKLTRLKELIPEKMAGLMTQIPDMPLMKQAENEAQEPDKEKEPVKRRGRPHVEKEKVVKERKRVAKRKFNDASEVRIKVEAEDGTVVAGTDVFDQEEEEEVGYTAQRIAFPSAVLDTEYYVSLNKSYANEEVNYTENGNDCVDNVLDNSMEFDNVENETPDTSGETNSVKKTVVLSVKSVKPGIVEKKLVGSADSRDSNACTVPATSSKSVDVNKTSDSTVEHATSSKSVDVNKTSDSTVEPVDKLDKTVDTTASVAKNPDEPIANAGKQPPPGEAEKTEAGTSGINQIQAKPVQMSHVKPGSTVLVAMPLNVDGRSQIAYVPVKVGADGKFSLDTSAVSSQPSSGSTQSTATQSSQSTATQSSQYTGTQSSQSTGTQSSQSTSTQSSKSTGTQSSQSTATQSSQYTGTQSSQSTGTQSSQSTSTQSSKSTGTQSSQSTGIQSSQSTGAQNSKYTGTQSLQATGTQSSQATGTQSSKSTGTQSSQATSTQSSQSTSTQSLQATGTQSSQATATQSSQATGTQSSQATATQSSQATCTQSSKSTVTQSSQSTGTQSSKSTGTQSSQSTGTQSSQSTGTQSSQSTATQNFKPTSTQSSKSTGTDSI